MLGNLLKIKLEEYDISQEELVRRIKKRKPSYKIYRPQITRYCSGETTLKRDKLLDLFVLGFGWSVDMADQTISEFILRQEGGNFSEDRLHEILMKDSDGKFDDGKNGEYHLLTVYKSLKDAYMEHGETIGQLPKPPGIEYEDERLFWAPDGDSKEGLVLVLRNPKDLIHGKKYVFKIGDHYQLNRYEMPIDRERIKPVGLAVGYFQYY